MSAKMSIFDKRCAFFISGASRGYGRAIVLSVATELAGGQLKGEGSLIVGTSRCQERLDALGSEVASVCPAVEFQPLCVELDNMDAMPKVLSSIVKVDMSYDAAIILHNAGDAGDMTVSCQQQSDAKACQRSFDLNLNSMIQLNGAFLRQFEKSSSDLFVVNISSLLAIEAFPGLHMYAMMKSARDMYVKVLAKEQASVRCLNWAPGPMPTDLFEEICSSSSSPDIRESFGKMLAEKTYVTCEASSAKLISVLKANSFESGAHVDYYDV